MNVFDGFNLVSHRNAKANLPDEEEINFLKEVTKFSSSVQIKEGTEEKMQEIGENIDAIIEYNTNLNTNDDNDHRLVLVPKEEMDLFLKAKENLGILSSGGVLAYRKERLKELLMSHPTAPRGYNVDAEMASFYPEDYDKKLSPKGNWIFILDKIGVECAPKKYSFHYATPLSKPCNAYGGKHRTWFASIVSKDKEVLLHPHEYAIVKDANLLLETIDNGITLIEGSKSARLDKNKVFYLQSRGFNKAEVYRILFKSVKTKGFCHFESDKEFIEAFDNLGKFQIPPKLATVFNLHIENMPIIKFKAV